MNDSLRFLDVILKKCKSNAEIFQGKFPQPCRAYNGKYTLGSGGNWVDGFFPGILHIAYVLSGDETFLIYTRKYDDFFDLRLRNEEKINKENHFLPLDHDVGMIFLPFLGAKYTLFGGKKEKNMLLAAADILLARYNEKGKFIRAWDTWSWDTDPDFIEEKKGKVIIDSMMNLPLLFKAALISGEKRYEEAAVSHADNIANYIVRSDGSTYHSYNFDYRTGKAICGKTIQGYADDSCWARGQAWAIYGFALAYKYTSSEKFKIISSRTADYFLNHLDAVGLPCWDFDAVQCGTAPWDSSAAAIAASGLLELFEITNEENFRKNALCLLDSLNRFCSTAGYPSEQPLLLHGCSSPAYRRGENALATTHGSHDALIYGDYFYLECYLKLSGNKFRIF